MLESLTISNLGIITAASVELDPGLTVLTGETGAGKSMILQSIGLLMGNRASAELVLDSADRARVDCEVKFSGISEASVLALVEDSGGECEEIENSADRSLLISREITQSGRGKFSSAADRCRQVFYAKSAKISLCYTVNLIKSYCVMQISN